MTSPFLEIHELLQEPSSLFSHLRIIAMDAPKLKSADREILKQAADEIERSQRTLATVYSALLEREQALMATKEQNAALQRKLGMAPILPFQTMGALIIGDLTPKGWTP